MPVTFGRYKLKVVDCWGANGWSTVFAPSFHPDATPSPWWGGVGTRGERLYQNGADMRRDDDRLSYFALSEMADMAGLAGLQLRPQRPYVGKGLRCLLTRPALSRLASVDDSFDHDELLRSRQVAVVLDASRRTVQHWAATGALRATRTPGRAWRFQIQDVVAFLDPVNAASATQRVRELPPANPQPPTPGDGWLPLLAAAKEVGIARGTLRRWIRDGNPTTHRRGREILVRRKDLDAFVERCRITAL